MYRFARYIHALLIVPILAGTLFSLTGCGLTDPPSKRLYGGAAYNFSDNNANIHLENPPAEYSTGTDPDKNYSIPRRFDAMQNGRPGVQSYWLHEKSQADPAYHFVITSLEGNHLGDLWIRPDGIYNDSPDPVNSQPGLDWWVRYPDGGSNNMLAPEDISRAIAQLTKGGEQ